MKTKKYFLENSHFDIIQNIGNFLSTESKEAYLWTHSLKTTCFTCDKWDFIQPVYSQVRKGFKGKYKNTWLTCHRIFLNTSLLQCVVVCNLYLWYLKRGEIRYWFWGVCSFTFNGLLDLCWLSFELRILITPSVSSNTSLKLLSMVLSSLW